MCVCVYFFYIYCCRPQGTCAFIWMAGIVGQSEVSALKNHSFFFFFFWCAAEYFLFFLPFSCLRIPSKKPLKIFFIIPNTIRTPYPVHRSFKVHCHERAFVFQVIFYTVSSLRYLFYDRCEVLRGLGSSCKLFLFSFLRGPLAIHLPCCDTPLCERKVSRHSPNRAPQPPPNR